MKDIFTFRGILGLISIFTVAISINPIFAIPSDTSVENTKGSYFISSIPQSTRTVTNTNDNGEGSLRHAIENAETGDMIVFAPSTIGQPISLETGPIIIDTNIKIQGLFRNATIIDGNDISQVIIIQNGTKCSISDLKIVNGKTDTFGAGIENNGSLELTNVDIENCKVQSNVSEKGIAGGGAALSNFGDCKITNCILRGNIVSGAYAMAGGAIFNDSSMEVINTQITGNICGSLENAFGGGICNMGDIEVHNCTLSGNTISILGPDQSGYAISAGALVSFNENVSVTNSIIWGNSNTAFPEVRLADTELNPSQSFFANTLILNIETDNFIGIEAPMFEQPIFQAGATTTGDFNLKCTSPLIDQGKNQLYTDIMSDDLSGNQRIQNGDGIGDINIDLGAFEYTELVPTVETHIACDSYTWANNEEYTESIDNEIMIMTNSLGCDSVVSLNLTINYNTEATDTHQACAQFTWTDGSVYKSDNNTAEIISENESGCPHTTTLDLTFIEIESDIIIDRNVLTATQAGLEYQWLDCNNSMEPIPGAIYQSFYPEIGGNYMLRTSFGNCFEYSECTANMVLGIENDDIFNEVSIFPNPTTGAVNINLGALRGVNVKVLDITGKEIENFNSGFDSKVSFEIINAQGVYIIELNLASDSQHFKLIKN